MIKYIKNVLWRVAKRLSCIENDRCLKVNVLLNDIIYVSMTTATSALHRTSAENWHYFAVGAVVLYFIVTHETEKKGCVTKNKVKYCSTKGDFVTMSA